MPKLRAKMAMISRAKRSAASADCVKTSRCGRIGVRINVSLEICPMPYLQGVARDEPLALPATLDEYITPDNSVRVIDAFIDQLDLHTLGFVRATPKSTGRPAYPPATLL